MRLKVIISSLLAMITLAVVTMNGAATNTQAEEPARKLIRIGSLNTVESNQEFERNVRLLQAQRARAVELSKAIETAQTGAAKEALQQELNQIMVKLNENNKKMFESYGFSITRNYTRVIESSHIYMFVTEEEAKRYEENQKKLQQSK